MKYLTPEQYKEYVTSMTDKEVFELWQSAKIRSKGYTVSVASPLYSRHEKYRVEREAQDARYRETEWRAELVARGYSEDKLKPGSWDKISK